MMLLDIRTIYVVTAITTLAIGALQLVAFFTARSEQWVAGSGVGNMLLGGGLMLSALRGQLDNALTIDAANTIALAAYFLLLASMRALSSGRMRWAPYFGAALCGGILLSLYARGAGDFAIRIAWVSLACAASDVAIGVQGWQLQRREGLVSARILAIAFFISGALFLFRCFLALSGLMGDTLFSLGSSVYHWLTAIAAPSSG